MAGESSVLLVAEQIIKESRAVPDAAHEKHPKRFQGKIPTPMESPPAAGINKPASP
jgi:hypothetical protein